MNVFEMVVVIVLVVTIGRIIQMKYHHRNSGTSTDDRVDIAAMNQKIDQLNQRVQVLEKLATDPSKRLADEIDRLRT